MALQDELVPQSPRHHMAIQSEQGQRIGVNVVTHQPDNRKRIPIEDIPASETPNETTQQALVAAEAKELGLEPDDATCFNDVDELMSYLDEG